MAVQDTRCPLTGKNVNPFTTLAPTFGSAFVNLLWHVQCLEHLTATDALFPFSRAISQVWRSIHSEFARAASLLQQGTETMERHEQTGNLPKETATTKTYQKDLFQTTIASCSPVEVSFYSTYSILYCCLLDMNMSGFVRLCDQISCAMCR